jgi:hypothetical protein
VAILNPIERKRYFLDMKFCGSVVLTISELKWINALQKKNALPDYGKAK